MRRKDGEKKEIELIGTVVRLMDKSLAYAPKNEKRLNKEGHEILETGWNVNPGRLPRAVEYSQQYIRRNNIVFTEREQILRSSARQAEQNTVQRRRYPWKYVKRKNTDGTIAWEKREKRYTPSDFVPADQWDVQERSKQRGFIYNSDPNDPLDDWYYDPDDDQVEWYYKRATVQQESKGDRPTN